MKRIIVGLAIVGCMFPAVRATAQGDPEILGLLYGFKICKGAYALCAASICKPTGGTIEVNVPGGGTATFPESECICPVFTGPAIADPNGGNMQGSCERPGKDQVWSLYYPKTNVPQEINLWRHKAADTAVTFQECAASANVGASFTNCFSFSCTLDKKRRNGVRTATCRCPMGENPNGSAVPANTTVVTPAGQADPSVCNLHPVGAAYPSSTD